LQDNDSENTQKIHAIAERITNLEETLEELDSEIATTKETMAEKIKQLKSVGQSLTISHAGSLGLKSHIGPSDISDRPNIGEPCDGSDWPRLHKSCKWMSVPVYTEWGQVAFEKVRARCYSTNTSLESSWEFWFDDNDIDSEDARLKKGYGIGNLYVASGEQGVCMLPREKSCISDAQCRMGTTCLQWKGAPNKWRCGTLQDSGSDKIKQVDTISHGMAILDEKLNGLKQGHGKIQLTILAKERELRELRLDINEYHAVDSA
jgi:hypothetical protein